MPNNTLRLPLWEGVLDKMIETGVNHGDVFDAEFFELGLQCQRTSFEFGIGVAQIRAGLERKGLYLSGRGFKGAKFQILPAKDNVNVMRSYQREAVVALSRAITLGSSTNTMLLNESEKKRHEECLERIAVKAALMQRSTRIHNFIQANRPQLMGE